MLFPLVSPSLEECTTAISEALQDDHGRIYLDANVLIHCYEMSSRASETLLRTLERYGNRVGVPIWAARETWDYITKRTNKRPLYALSERMRTDFTRFRTETTRYIDNSALGGSSKENYQKEVVEAFGEALTLIQRVAQHEPKIDETTGRLLPFIDERRVPSRLTAIIEEVSRTAAARIAHRVPPGFADAPPPSVEEENHTIKSKGKIVNPHGDIIIWFEILEDCLRHQAEHLVIVTRDTRKEDWVYSPKKVRDDKGRLQDNRTGITLALPLLVYEAQQACPSLKSVHIISVEMLAAIWTMQRFDVSDLAAALQADEEEPAPDDNAQDSGSARGDESDAAYTAEFGSADMTYEPDPDDDLDQLIVDLSIDGWKAQNQAVRRLEPQLGSLNRAQRIQVGRELVSAANTGAVEPAEVLDRVLSNKGLGRPLRSDLLIGALAETYIAETGEPKKPIATRGIAASLYQSQGDEEVADAYDAVLSRLRALRREYLALPHEDPREIKLDIALQMGELVNVSVGEFFLLEQDAPPARALQRSGNDVTMSIAELVDLLAEEFVVPASALVTDLSATTSISVPEHLGFVAWGPQTGMYLR
ncbi:MULTISPECIES: PIN-like domain-containing protein [unclassified Mesorhizobium]|uniref:PIN-like domain-containing protein n=1 Tax=unclassified Mesorhizobium TaxID=325217 RepID=UPI0003CFF5BE|nr:MULTISPECIES: PIN-like domain-containing protein [unclassified Mesorhizobium]ESZ61437.1 hypothetical protein X728_12760 [Mesorhizobium sp. L103C120A0]WJI43574.1 PIN-like domain-containing protein [Mesorhizobium sp. C120A]